jgi:hypothetical protein
MRITYPKAIAESEEDLTELEQRLRGEIAADRVRMLRLLKSATVTSMRVLRAAARLQPGPTHPAFGNATAEQAWQSSSSSRNQSGRRAKSRPRRGRTCWPRWARDTWPPWKMRVMTWSANGASATRTASRCGGSWAKQRVKWKTGRRRHKKANAEQQAAFQKPSEA